jgi:hypothetical protein
LASSLALVCVHIGLVARVCTTGHACMRTLSSRYKRAF